MAHTTLSTVPCHRGRGEFGIWLDQSIADRDPRRTKEQVLTAILWIACLAARGSQEVPSPLVGEG
jgi:hypothetical protein